MWLHTTKYQIKKIYFNDNDNAVQPKPDIRKKYKDIDMSLFLKRYKEVRDKANITHWKLCKKTELSESSLRHWQYGDTPSIESLIIIATNLSTSIDYLVGRI